MNSDSKKEELIHLLQIEQKNNSTANAKKNPLLVKAILESVSAGCGPFASFLQTSKNGYNNPSIYCETLKKIYLRLTSFLIENGVSIDKIAQSLGQNQKSLA